MANQLGRWSKGGASAERMYRTLADPQYQKSSNRCASLVYIAPRQCSCWLSACVMNALICAEAGGCKKCGLQRSQCARLLLACRHGCRLNPRDGTPMHVMVEYALQRLPGQEGNIDAIAKVIEANPEYARQLDYSARPGTKTYPRCAS